MQPTQRRGSGLPVRSPGVHRAGETRLTRGAFWRERSLDELAAEQGIAVPQALDQMIGAAAELWDDDDDFDLFVGRAHEPRLTQREVRRERAMGTSALDTSIVS